MLPEMIQVQLVLKNLIIKRSLKCLQSKLMTVNDGQNDIKSRGS